MLQVDECSTMRPRLPNRPMKLMAGGGRPQLIAGVVQTITAPFIIVGHLLAVGGAGFDSFRKTRMCECA